MIIPKNSPNRPLSSAGSTKPSLAPGMITSHPLDENATNAEIEHDDFTEVTRLEQDRIIEE